MPSPEKSRRVALITGGTTGIGFATARILHEQNYAVVVTGANPERIATARNALPRDVVVLRADARLLADTQASRTRSGPGTADWMPCFSTPASGRCSRSRPSTRLRSTTTSRST
jgi:hypothetical protein